MKVRHIEKGINPSSLSKIYFSGEYLLKGFKIGVVAGVIALTVSYCFNHSHTLKKFSLSLDESKPLYFLRVEFIRKP